MYVRNEMTPKARRQGNNEVSDDFERRFKNLQNNHIKSHHQNIIVL
jgi:hypothetical protein